jgi:hypothetical protein
MILMALSPARLLFGEGDLAPGARVRVTVTAATNQEVGDRTREKRIQGKLLALDEATMTIETEGQPRPPIVVPRPEIKKLEVSTRKSRKGRAALIGAGMGALIGGALGYSLADDCSREELFCIFPKEDRSKDALGGALLVGALGAGLGALIGPGERWQERPVAQLRLTVAPTRGRGAAISLALRF